jgi:hypothetical protein
MRRRVYAFIRGQIADTTDGSEDGILTMVVKVNGADPAILTCTPSFASLNRPAAAGYVRSHHLAERGDHVEGDGVARCRRQARALVRRHELALAVRRHDRLVIGLAVGGDDRGRAARSRNLCTTGNA